MSARPKLFALKTYLTDFLNKTLDEPDTLTLQYGRFETGTAEPVEGVIDFNIYNHGVWASVLIGDLYADDIVQELVHTVSKQQVVEFALAWVRCLWADYIKLGSNGTIYDISKDKVILPAQTQTGGRKKKRAAAGRFLM